MITYEENHLAHYGITGQKWHVRRFQNEDGTLTELGKQRYLKNMDDRERKDYRQLHDRDRAYVEKQMDSGKSYREAKQSLAKRKNTIATVTTAAAVTALAVGGTWLGKYGKHYARTGIESIKASKAAWDGMTWIRKSIPAMRG